MVRLFKGIRVGIRGEATARWENIGRFSLRVEGKVPGGCKGCFRDFAKGLNSPRKQLGFGGVEESVLMSWPRTAEYIMIQTKKQNTPPT